MVYSHGVVGNRDAVEGASDGADKGSAAMS